MIKKALVTGASSGIGLATALSLGKAGWQVTGVARNFNAQQKGVMRCIELDLSQLDVLQKQLDAGVLDAEGGDYDCVILGAGAGLFGGLEQFSYQQIQNTVNLNLLSQIYLCKYFLPNFRHAGGKDIVLIGSESALRGAKQGSVYCATKFALRGFAQSLRADLATADVRVMLLNAGPVDTEFFRELHFTPRSGARFVIQPESVAEAIFNALALPRNVVQEEILLQPVLRAFDKKPVG